MFLGVDKVIAEPHRFALRLFAPSKQPFGSIALVDEFPRTCIVHPYRQRVMLDQETEQILALLAFRDVQYPDDERGAPAIDAATAVGRTPDGRSACVSELDFVIPDDLAVAGERTDFIEFARIHEMIRQELRLVRRPFSAKQVRRIEAFVEDLPASRVHHPNRQRVTVRDAAEYLGVLLVRDLRSLHLGNVDAYQGHAAIRPRMCGEQLPPAIQCLGFNWSVVDLRPSRCGAFNKCVARLDGAAVETL
nr:hypothetical protein [Mesorhizobium sp.]